MQSHISETLKFHHQPVAIVFSDEKPEGAKQFPDGKWGCVMFLLAAAIKGDTAVFDKNSFGCQGGGVGLGFGDQYENFAGGKECFKYFLSIGNKHWREGQKAGEAVKPFMRPEAYNHFMHGERYFKSPELVTKYIDCLPMTEVDSRFVMFKPLAQVTENDDLQVVIFFCNLDQIAALNVLVNYGRGHNENVIFPFAAGCQTIGIYPYREALRPEPRAVLGLSDISARLYLKRIIKDDVMTFAVPTELYREMEENLDGSFLQQEVWHQLQILAKP